VNLREPHRKLELEAQKALCKADGWLNLPGIDDRLTLESSLMHPAILIFIYFPFTLYSNLGSII
jgi:hypothetical protein